MKCAICGIEVETVEEGIENGWIPIFYERESEYGPACPMCYSTMLNRGEDGELELKPKYHGKIKFVGDYCDKGNEDHILVGIVIEDNIESKIH